MGRRIILFDNVSERGGRGSSTITTQTENKSQNAKGGEERRFQKGTRIGKKTTKDNRVLARSTSVQVCMDERNLTAYGGNV